MKKYVFKRLCIAVVTVFVILFVLFLMLELMPGSPFNDEKMTETQKMMLNQKYGLDKPVLVRFFNDIRNMLTGDFGVSYSIQKNMPVADMLWPRLLISLRLGLQAAAVGSVIGLVLGIVAALKRNTWFDTLATIVSVLGISLPSFVFALGLSYFLGFKVKLFPLIYSTAEPGLSSVLPTISLCMFTVASIARYARSEMVEVLTSDYIQLADAKGISRTRLITRHALRNTLIGIITVLAPLVVNLMTGSLVVEKAFSIPGIGSYFITAIQNNDYNVILGISFIYSVMFIGVMLLVDVLYGVIDPRIRLAKEE